MRVVLTSLPAYSHLVPVLLPVGRLLQAAGHDVVVATGAAGAEDVRRAGLATVALPSVRTIGEVMREALAQEPELTEVLRGPPGSVTMAIPPWWFARMFLRVMGRRFGADLVEAVEPPDLVVRAATEYGGYLAAERWGVPQATLDIAPMVPYDHRAMLEELDAARRSFGLGPVSDPWHPVRPLRAGIVPEVFYPSPARLPTARYYRAALAADEPLDPAIADLPDDRPLVLASLGSVAPMMLGERPRLLDAIIRALGALPVTAVVALGAGRSAEEWSGARPSNVHLAAFVQQRALLPACDLFITHGGFNSVREAIGAGVPMVALPIFAEQPANAARVEELGAGVRLVVEDVTPTSLCSAVLRVLGEPAFRARARGLQRRVLALPPLGQIVADLRALAP